MTSRNQGLSPSDKGGKGERAWERSCTGCTSEPGQQETSKIELRETVKEFQKDKSSVPVPEVVTWQELLRNHTQEAMGTGYFTKLIGTNKYQHMIAFSFHRCPL